VQLDDEALDKVPAHLHGGQQRSPHEHAAPRRCRRPAGAVRACQATAAPAAASIWQLLDRGVALVVRVWLAPCNPHAMRASAGITLCPVRGMSAVSAGRPRCGADGRAPPQEPRRLLSISCGGAIMLLHPTTAR
jgi:hypothetical protein